VHRPIPQALKLVQGALRVPQASHRPLRRLGRVELHFSPFGCHHTFGCALQGSPLKNSNALALDQLSHGLVQLRAQRDAALGHGTLGVALLALEQIREICSAPRARNLV
jgi:hypothetical protein